MNIERDDLVKTLSEIARGGCRPKIVRLREIFDEVEEAKKNGASNKEIVVGLASHGLIFDVNNFKVARSRILKERLLEKLTNTTQKVKPSNPVLKGEKAGETKPVVAVKNAVAVKGKEAAANGKNPFSVLTGRQKEGEHNAIPTAKFELSDSEKEK